jgi:ribonuclease VapC
VAVVNDEPEAEGFHGLLPANEPLISCGTLIETLREMQVAIGPPEVAAIERLLRVYGVALEPVDAGQIELARDGMLAYGQGRGQELAVLNFGDLFAYALAKRLGLPLLLKGDDFARTDVISLPLTTVEEKIGRVLGGDPPESGRLRETRAASGQRRQARGAGRPATPQSSA